jgi:hypothetical protein
MRTIGQRRWHSLIESLANVAVGYSIALATQLLVFPWFGIHVALGANVEIGAVFTVVSIVRSFYLRRVFNAWHVLGAPASSVPLQDVSLRFRVFPDGFMGRRVAMPPFPASAENFYIATKGVSVRCPND